MFLKEINWNLLVFTVNGCLSSMQLSLVFNIKTHQFEKWIKKLFLIWEIKFQWVHLILPFTDKKSQTCTTQCLVYWQFLFISMSNISDRDATVTWTSIRDFLSLPRVTFRDPPSPPPLPPPPSRPRRGTFS